MVQSGRFNPRGKNALAHTEQEAVWTPDTVRMFWKIENLLLVPEMKPRFLGRPARGVAIEPRMKVALQYKLLRCILNNCITCCVNLWIR